MSSSTLWRVCFNKRTQKFGILPHKPWQSYQLAPTVMYYIDSELLPQGIIHVINKNKDFDTADNMTWISSTCFEFDINNINPQDITNLRNFVFMKEIVSILISNKKNNLKQIELLSNESIITNNNFENGRKLKMNAARTDDDKSGVGNSSSNGCTYNELIFVKGLSRRAVAKNDGQGNRRGCRHKCRKSESGRTRLGARDRPVARKSVGGVRPKGFGGAGHGIRSGKGCDGPVPKMSKTYQCKDCSMKFDSLLEFDKHKLTHISNRPFKCQFQGCKRSFNNMANCKNHYQSHESGNNSNNSD